MSKPVNLLRLKLVNAEWWLLWLKFVIVGFLLQLVNKLVITDSKNRADFLVSMPQIPQLRLSAKNAIF